VRGFDKVRGEWSLMALCYNFTRVLSILGIDRFPAHLAKRHPHWLSLLLAILVGVGWPGAIARLQAQPSRNPSDTRPAFTHT
jgi:hypothetical protein